MELWLPAEGWNGKFLAMGNGAWAGTIPLDAVAAGLRRGYATAANDTGHKGGSASFLVGHPEKLVDFAYRAMHEMAVQWRAGFDVVYGVRQRRRENVLKVAGYWAFYRVVALLSDLLLIVGLEIQVRLVEEPHLLRSHGESYRRYAERVGRFLPGVGRLTPAGAGRPTERPG